MARNQRTIASEVTLPGVGLHTGEATQATFQPAPIDTGIVFVRDDLPGAPTIAALIDNVVDISRGTTLGDGKGMRVMTVEHILAACAGLEIDNLVCRVTAQEVPVLDGSASEFTQRLRACGIVDQDAPCIALRITETIQYSDPGRGVDIHVLPFPGFRMTFMVDYRNPALGTQYTTLNSLKDEFEAEFASARTFCFLSEVTKLVDAGLIRGGSLENAIVIVDLDLHSPEAQRARAAVRMSEEQFVSTTGILGDVPLQFYNEPVRHKVVDMLGDLKLLGVPIEGHIIAARSGHKANVELVRLLKKQLDKQTLRARLQPNADAGGAFLDINGLLNLLPHRYPFLLLDRILELEIGKRVVALKNVTINEPFFMGHFPEHPIMPGVLLLEVMAQAGALLIQQSIGASKDKLAYFSAIDSVKFRRPVMPGDQLRVEVDLLAVRLGTAKLAGRIFVGEKLVVEASFMASMVARA